MISIPQKSYFEAWKIENIPLNLNPKNIIGALPVQTGSSLILFFQVLTDNLILSDKGKNVTWKPNITDLLPIF